MAEHVIATYNMSWATDSNESLNSIKMKASEYAFASGNPNPDNRRAYWENAKDLLKKFINEKKPCAVGLQEMNKVDSFIKDIPDNDVGSRAIDKMLSEFQSLKYKQICETVNSISAQQFIGTIGSTAATVGISMIINIDTMGQPQKIKTLDNMNQIGAVLGGRPVLMVLTENNYLLVSIHGAQDPAKGKNMEEFNKYMVENNKKFLESEIVKFLDGTTPKNIFVMGDFNDRYDAIQDITVNNMKLTYKGDSPYSCCHNWDSSCKQDRFKPFGSTQYGTCDVSQATVGTEVFKANLKVKLPEYDGDTANYRYKGDKVFGLNPSADIQIYPGSTSIGPSVESDHQLVYASFMDTSTEGGRRRRRTRSRRARKSRRQNKRRASRRSRH